MCLLSPAQNLSIPGLSTEEAHSSGQLTIPLQLLHLLTKWYYEKPLPFSKVTNYFGYLVVVFIYCLVGRHFDQELRQAA